VAFFRGRQPEASVWRRFRTNVDGFTFEQEGEYYVAHAVANAERVVDLFHSLAEHLPPAVDVAIEDLRDGRSWVGEALALPDVREAIARLKAPLAANGGVEISVYSSEDQVSLTPQLELFIYARTDQWLYILQGKGMQEAATVPPRSWKVSRAELGPSPELADALATAVERLALRPA
jgi:hypothetical protein